MKLFNCAGLAFTGLILLAGCSAPVNVQKDDSVNFATYRTYTWVDTRSSETDTREKPAAFADISVRNAANKALQKSGWREVKNNADLLISYDVLVERSTERSSDPVYSQPYSRMYFNPYTRRWNTMYYPSQFLGYDTYDTPVKEGTITITMVDAKTDKPVWQGWTTERLEQARLTADEISDAVNNIFRKFDIAKM